MNRDKLNAVMASAEAVLRPGGFECIEAEWNPQEALLRLYIDREGGVDMAACVAATELLQGWAGIEGRPAGSYNLEVSSPGIERPLRRQEHFVKYLERDIAVRLRPDKAEGRRSGRGKLVAVSPEGQLTVHLAEEGCQWCFAVESVHKAHLVHHWDR